MSTQAVQAINPNTSLSTDLSLEKIQVAMPEDRVERDWRIASRATGATFLVALVYAITRYVILSTKTAPDNIPLYISDKAIAFTGLFLFCASFSYSPLMARFPVMRKYVGLRRTLGLAGFFMALLHSLINFIIMNPSYHAKFFLPTGRMTWLGELSILTGVTALMVFAALAISSIEPIRRSMKYKHWKALQRTGLVGLGLVLVHLVAMGYKTWIDYQAWPQGLPPITFWSTLVILVTAGIRMMPVGAESK